MLASLIIVFREIIEAGLVIGIVLAATKGVPKRGRWVAYGIAGGVGGAVLVAIFAAEIAGWFEGSGQELFNAAILVVAVTMLTTHNVWMASHGRAMAQDMRDIGAAVSDGRRSLFALSMVVGIAVLREGAEIVLFLYGIAATGGTSSAGMLTGGVLGVAVGAVISALMYGGLLSIPTRHLFAATTGLITLLAAGMAAQAVAFLQQGGYAEALATPVWNSAWLLADDSLVGRMLHALIGYTDSPTGLQLVAYLATIVTIIALMRLIQVRAEMKRQPATS
ncbi:MAG TPA: FTR1 family protein [Telmatospirillum sp.]|nr:FTR1 family protein [Telmatospirillum sp.]